MPKGFTSKRVFLPLSDRIGRLEYEKETIYSEFSVLQRGFNLDVTDMFQLLLAFVFSKGHFKCYCSEFHASPERRVLCLSFFQTPEWPRLFPTLSKSHSTGSSLLALAAEGTSLLFPSHPYPRGFASGSGKTRCFRKCDLMTEKYIVILEMVSLISLHPSQKLMKAILLQQKKGVMISSGKRQNKNSHRTSSK